MRVLVIDNPARPHAQAGQVVDLPDAEAKTMISRGTAVLAADEPVATTQPDEPPAELPAPETDEPPEVARTPAKPPKKPKAPAKRRG